MAKARNLPKRLRVKSETRSQESSAGRTFSKGRITKSEKPTSQNASPSRSCFSPIGRSSFMPLPDSAFTVRMPKAELRIQCIVQNPAINDRLFNVSPFDRKQPGRPPLQEQNHEHQDQDFTIDGPETGLQQFVEPADA